jgi:hypothetical protein
MADEDTNTHPGTTAEKISSVVSFVSKNPIVAGLFGLFLLGLVMPPRVRKRKQKKVRSKKTRRNKNKQPKQLRGLKKRRKKLPRSVGRINTGPGPGVYADNKNRKKLKKYKSTKARSGPRPAFMIAGTKAAKDHMAKLRAMRKK